MEKNECRIGTCRKKVMGLLRLMGNKADVVKGLAKRCNENWSMAPKSDIVRPSALSENSLPKRWCYRFDRACTSLTSKTI